MKMFRCHRMLKILFVLLSAAMALVVTGCVAGLYPQVTYQGRLTDQSGNPLDGQVRLRFSLYHADTGGTAIYAESDTVQVTDGLFDTVVGPATVTAGLSPKDLAEPLWMEVQVSNGTYTETLTPRQRLYGAPYAFTLMPGAVISQTMNTNAHGLGGLEAILSVYNTFDGDTSNPALPALRLVGENGLELASPTSRFGTIISDRSYSTSEIQLFSHDDIELHLDYDNTGAGYVKVYNGTGTDVCLFTEGGDLSCDGDLTFLGSKSAAVDVGGNMYRLYAMESPEVWFEDFGSSQLANGSVFVTIDPLFAQSVNLGSDYHVFLTPLGDCNGLYIASKGPDGFEVRELGGGAADIAFDYRIIAKRAGYEGTRMELLGPIDEEQEAAK